MDGDNQEQSIDQTIEAMVKTVLPQLHKALKKIYLAKDYSTSPDEDLTELVKDSYQMIQALHGWCGGDPAIEQEISSQEEDALLADMSVTQDQEGGQSSKEIAANDSEDILEDSDHISEDEAMAIMRDSNDMDAMSAATMEAAVSSDAGEDELSDEEAMALLAQMEDGTSDPGDEEISEDEAQKLLAEMEGSAGDDDISDDEAQKLLAEMEGDASSSSAANGDEDDAEALLAQLGGGEEDDEGEANPPVSNDKTVEEIGEIDEWERNDFQTDPDMVNDFITNSDEIMEKLDEVIIQLEQEPDNKEVIEEIFRGAHTLKGAAGMFGFKGIERVMHRMENLFDLIRKGKLAPSADTIDVVFEGLDVLRVLLQAVKDGAPCGAKTAQVVYALEQVAKGKTSGLKRGSGTSSEPSDAPAANEDNQAAAGKSGASKDQKKKEQSTIRVDLERLDVLVNLVGELVIDRTRFSSIEEDLRTNFPHVELGGSFSETVQLFGRHMNEIQDIIMKVRMVPIGNAFNKFTRIVRDLSRSLDKKIDLFISGETAELDKTLVEQIGDPLIHLIRNSCDHGIETPAVREAAGKNPTGRITLSASQEGNHIVIVIEDDGKGIPPDIIRKKGIEKGLISEDQQLENRDIFNLIFEPGFSTAEQVTNISGRGVGMDVVKKNIMKLKGMIEIDSELGKGTTTTIRLPLTLAIVQSLLVRSYDEVFAIPLSSVIESIRISPNEIQKVGDAEVYKLRDKVLPLIHLADALDLSQKKGSYASLLKETKSYKKFKPKSDRLFIVVVGHADRPTGIVVDQLLNQQEMVIKSMGGLMKDIPCVAGGAVLGHGEVVLVLDIPELEETTKGKGRLLAA